MNLGNLITEAGRLAGRVDRDWHDRIRRWLNEGQIQWALQVPWPSLRRKENFVAPGTQTMVLPPRVLTPLRINDATNKRYILPGDSPDREAPATYLGATGGTAEFWRERGMVAVFRQPPAAGYLWVDTTSSWSFSAHITGLALDTTMSGTAEEYRFVTETIALASESPVTSANQYVRVDAFGKDDYTGGDLRLWQSTTLLSRVPADKLAAQYREIEFLMVPAAGTLINVEYILSPPDLIDDEQVPHPAISPEYLIWYAASIIHSAQPGQAQDAQLKRVRADEILTKAIYKERMHGDKDLRAFPEPNYWATEDSYIVPGGAGWVS